MTKLTIFRYWAWMRIRMAWLFVRLLAFTLASMALSPIALVVGGPAYDERVNAGLSDYGTEALQIGKDFIDELHRRKIITDAQWNELFAQICAVD